MVWEAKRHKINMVSKYALRAAENKTPTPCQGQTSETNTRSGFFHLVLWLDSPLVIDGRPVFSRFAGELW
jgi:hypothetical protein